MLATATRGSELPPDSLSAARGLEGLLRSIHADVGDLRVTLREGLGDDALAQLPSEYNSLAVLASETSALLQRTEEDPSLLFDVLALRAWERRARVRRVARLWVPDWELPRPPSVAVRRRAQLRRARHWWPLLIPLVLIAEPPEFELRIDGGALQAVWRPAFWFIFRSAARRKNSGSSCIAVSAWR